MILTLVDPLREEIAEADPENVNSEVLSAPLGSTSDLTRTLKWLTLGCP